MQKALLLSIQYKQSYLVHFVLPSIEVPSEFQTALVQSTAEIKRTKHLDFVR